MARAFRTGFLAITFIAYRLIRPFIFLRDAQAAHELVLSLLKRCDDSVPMKNLARIINRLAYSQQPVDVGGVRLPCPVILAAGFVKGLGFPDERVAIQTAHNENIIPGWRIMPLLVGPVEFGSFTPYPRTGNTGQVLWRDIKTESTQNRVGLRNPGAQAAAIFLEAKNNQLPAVFGINIAPSPGIEDLDAMCQEVTDSINAFLSRNVIPSWFTLNLSCPNTEDDPGNIQTESRARQLCSRIISMLSDHKESSNNDIPLWVKVSPDLSDVQYHVLMRVFHETGIKAVIATNTLGLATPEDSALVAGLGGGRLFPYTLRVIRLLKAEVTNRGYEIDLVASGGALSRASFQELRSAGAKAVQYWSALVYNGPLAGAYLIIS